MSPIYGDDEVMKHIGSRRRGMSPAETKRMLEHFIENYETDGFGIWACVMNYTGELIGHCGFNTLPDGMVEIAYLFDKNTGAGDRYRHCPPDARRRIQDIWFR